MSGYVDEDEARAKIAAQQQEIDRLTREREVYEGMCDTLIDRLAECGCESEWVAAANDYRVRNVRAEAAEAGLREYLLSIDALMKVIVSVHGKQVDTVYRDEYKAMKEAHVKAKRLLSKGDKRD